MALRVYSNNWDRASIHGVAAAAGYRWRVTSKGIQVEQEELPRRTKGDPITLTRIKEKFNTELEFAATRYSVELPLLAAVVATESKGDPRAERYEAKLNDYSFGLTQTLTTTAAFLIDKYHFVQTHPVAKQWDEWRDLLFQPQVSILCAASYLHMLDTSQDLRGDPVLLYAAYNSGTARVGDTPWGVTYYRALRPDGTVMADAMETFVKWYGDACLVFGFGGP